MKNDLKSISLEEFLNHKTLYYDKIDFSIIEKSWNILSKEITLPFVVHIVGTNGKGSTGRFLSHYLHKSSYKVLHYSSPHILEFNERIWINGRNSSDEDLKLAHKNLQKILPLEYLEKLTYFEYTTLMAFYLSKDLDYLILEAGLGGEFDATNVVKNDISLITTIDLDHQDFLGNSIKEIAATKIRSADKKIILGYQIHKEVYGVAKEISNLKKIELVEIKDFNKYVINNFPRYLQKNLHLAISCLKQMKLEVNLSYFDDIILFGRCQKIADNITIDVGHNPLAAKELLNVFKNKKVILIYNSYYNKDYKKVLTILKPIIKALVILPVNNNKRIVLKEKLEKVVEELKIRTYSKDFMDNNEDYLVFGSFSVVETFLLNFKK